MDDVKCSKANKARDFMIWDFMIKRPFLEQLEKNGKTPITQNQKLNKILLTSNSLYTKGSKFVIFFKKTKNKIKNH
jgi:hypothetical protein